MNIPESLVENLCSGLSVAWCGAGTSITSGLPTWQELLHRLIETCRNAGLNNEEINELHTMRERGDVDDVADYCRMFLGEGEYRQFLERLFNNTGKPSDIIYKLIELPFSIILTANYDKVIEQAIANKKSTFPDVFTNQDVNSIWRRMAKKEFFILKVHGDINRPETVVLSAQDYIKHVFGNASFMQYIQRLFMSHTVLFIGSSLRDLYIRRILEEISYLTDGFGMPHFALLYQPGKVESRMLRERFNVTVIPIQDWGELPHFLDELKNLVENGIETANNKIAPE